MPLKPNRTYNLLVLPSNGATYTVPGTKSQVTLDIFNACPEAVFVASGNTAIYAKEGEYGAYPIASGERAVLTFDTPTISATVRSLGGYVYITQV